MLQAPIITPVQESHGPSDVAKLGSDYQAATVCSDEWFVV